MTRHNIILALLLVTSWLSPLAQAASTSLLRSQTEKKPPLKWGLEIQYGYLRHQAYQLSATQRLANSSNALRVAGERLYPSRIGKFGLGLSIGFSGSTNIPVDTATAAVFTYPAGTFLSYRLDWVEDQFIVPFFRTGITYTWVRQVSDTGAAKPEAGNFDFNYVIGVAFLLDSIEPTYAEQLSSDAGIRNSYLVVDFITAKKLGPSEAPDVSLVAYHVGLRFEF